MTSDRNQIQGAIIEILLEMVGELDLDFEDPMSGETRLIADLGFASVDFIHLIVEIETRFDRKMGFHDLIMPNGRYVDDLPISELVDFVGERLSGLEEANEPPLIPAAELAASAGPFLSAEDIASFRRMMPRIDWIKSAPETPLPRMLFVLSAPRSGSTLLRVMLAGNERLFAPPELYLLNYRTMDQRHRALSNEENDHLLTGTVRAVMQLENCTVADAEQIVQRFEDEQSPTEAFYAYLQRILSGQMLVDKTPIYPMDPSVLQMAETQFDTPLFIHLVRHPCGMVRSFLEAKMERMIPFMRESGFSGRQLAELTWLTANANIADFLGSIPRERQLLLRYEDLVRDPAGACAQICALVGIPLCADMLDPYDDQKSRMTDGLDRADQFGGDLKFHLHDRIEPDAADRWKAYESEQSLNIETRALAATLGYS